jgi:hypothetical protein
MTKEQRSMRLAALILAPWLAAAVTVTANAAPVMPNVNDQATSHIVQVAGGCGRGFHRDWRGFCVRNYVRPYYGYRYYRPYYRYGYVRPYYRPYPYYGYYRPYRYW